MRTCINARMSSNFCQIPPLTMELSVIERLKNRHNDLVATLAPSFLIGSSSFFQVTRTTINAGMSSNFKQIGLLIVELP